MPGTTSKKFFAPPAPVCVDGIVFYVALRDDRWIETIGVPFKHRGRTWAVHRSTLIEPEWPTLFSVSDVETGQRVGRLEEESIDAARAAAIAKIDSITQDVWDKTFKPRRRTRVAVA